MHCPYLVRILFGMPSLHLFTFLMFFKSCNILGHAHLPLTHTPRPIIPDEIVIAFKLLLGRFEAVVAES